MAIFTTIALNVYVSLLRFLYQKRDSLELKKSLVEARTSAGDPNKRNSMDAGQDEPSKKSQ